jgi:3'-phosphoadenosine 5'-phosphosulfate sulfotransferase (PAPS reductase)/FAD synthetase
VVTEKERKALEGRPDLASYDHILVSFSGGKDSMACLLHLFEEGERLGVDVKSKIEIWHQDIDSPGLAQPFMDWPVTRSYCSAVADAFGLPFILAWRDGGYLKEILKEDARSASIMWTTPDGDLDMFATTDRAKVATRRMFPQQSPDLSVRWCSASLKIEVMERALNNQERFLHKRTLVVTGERAEESSARATYNTFELDRSYAATKRIVHHWRPVHGWSSDEVWEIITRWKVDPHPAYKLGWGRVSCMTCIFGSPDQWASVRKLDPERFGMLAGMEREFYLESGMTLSRSKKGETARARYKGPSGDPVTLHDMADAGTPFGWREKDARDALSDVYRGPIFVDRWIRPAGADAKESAKAGPT